MKVASALVSGPHPDADLAARAVRSALDKAGLERADNVILFLTHDFIRHAPSAVLAAARAAGCLQVFGSTTSGLFTEEGCLLDQPGAAVLVFQAEKALPDDDTPILSLTGHGTLPFDWQGAPPRAGLLNTCACTWAHGRISPNACAEVRLPGLRSPWLLSCGLDVLSQNLPVEFTQGYDLRRIDGISAADSLRRYLPAEQHEHPPIHQLVALRQRGEPAIPILSINADGSLTIGEALSEGETLCWARRHPTHSEQEIRQQLSAAVNPPNTPDFALMFSCIGRGPLFYGNDDRDLGAFREQFPGTPLLGAYGSGQIAPAGQRNRLFLNSVVTLLFESLHV